MIVDIGDGTAEICPVRGVLRIAPARPARLFAQGERGPSASARVAEAAGA
jgi:hypothetical protein